MLKIYFLLSIYNFSNGIHRQPITILKKSVHIVRIQSSYNNNNNHSIDDND